MINHKHDQIKEEIILKAKNLFVHEGFQKATMGDIARAISKKKSSLYYYFTSKEQIFEAITAREVAEATIILNSKLASITDPREKLKIYIETRFEITHKLATEFGAAWESAPEYYYNLSTLKQRIKNNQFEILTKILEDGVVQGIFSPSDLSHTTLYVASMIMGFEMSFANNDHQIEVTNAMNSLQKFILQGLTKCQ